jgi:hypothetical protein
VTTTVESMDVGSKPVAVAVTLVVPSAMGSKATPPVATVVGVLMPPGGITAVPEAPLVVEVTITPVAGLLELNVTVRGAVALTV